MPKKKPSQPRPFSAIRGLINLDLRDVATRSPKKEAIAVSPVAPAKLPQQEDERKRGAYRPFNWKYIEELLQDQPPDGSVFIVSSILTADEVTEKYVAWLLHHKYGRNWKLYQEAYERGEIGVSARTIRERQTEWVARKNLKPPE